MFEKGMLAIHEYCENSYKMFLEAVNTIPNGPLLVDNGKGGISAKDHASLRQGKIKFISKECPSLGYNTWIPKAIYKKVKKAFPRNQKGDYVAEWIGVNYLGLCINGNNFWFLSTCPQWEEIRRSLPVSFKLENEEAYLFWKTLHIKTDDLKAAMFSIVAERTPEFLYSIRNDYPHLLHHPALQCALSKAFQQNRLQEPLKCQGDRPDITPQIYELYYAVYCFRNEGESITNACIKAITKHPELVPKDWEDPQETLRKRVQRMDSYSTISLKEDNPPPKKAKRGTRKR